MNKASCFLLLVLVTLLISACGSSTCSECSASPLCECDASCQTNDDCQSCESCDCFLQEDMSVLEESADSDDIIDDIYEEDYKEVENLINMNLVCEVVSMPTSEDVAMVFIQLQSPAFGGLAVWKPAYPFYNSEASSFDWDVNSYFCEPNPSQVHDGYPPVMIVSANSINGETDLSLEGFEIQCNYDLYPLNDVIKDKDVLYLWLENFVCLD